MNGLPNREHRNQALARKAPPRKKPCPEALQREERSSWRIADGVWYERRKESHQSQGLFNPGHKLYARGHQLLPTGRQMVKVVPCSGSLSTSIVPLCSSMMPFTTVRPKPVPFPNSLVVKNGSNTLAITSRGIP